MVDVKVLCRPHKVVHRATDDIAVVFTVYMRTVNLRQGTHRILPV